MLIIMTVDAEQLPITSVGRVVFIVMVFVVDRQFPKFFTGKIPAAACTDPWEDLQRLFSVFYLFHCVFFCKGKSANPKAGSIFYTVETLLLGTILVDLPATVQVYSHKLERTFQREVA